MNIFEKLGLGALLRIDPELAHGVALRALRTPFAPSPGPVTSNRLRTKVAGLDLMSPIGLAAGFDKNAEVVAPLMKSGFGFIEVGAATPLAQPGNPKPRLFRLAEDHAAINRFGFNNDGIQAIADRLSQKPNGDVPVGLNLGANKDSPNRADDFIKVLELAQPHVDFATINVSSPNTEKLRDLQGPMALAALLDGVCQIRGKTPIFLKIAPDLSDQDIADIAKVATDARIDAIIATNTTLSRDNLKSQHAPEKGGLSGQPLFEASTRVLARLSTLTDIPLIGVGGVASGEQAYAKIKAGATAVQLYTGLVYGGLSLAAQIANDLDTLLARDGFENVSQAVGVSREAWL
ncbi:quinone-dependent dihydroorotate dehydrogenase [Pseudophaeobacter sp.]|uniref:quinone-dependent dihydroorotate dehydrogenase n=1 Tax=Pseudophaeobacter sp. TaxID=1971739 RepID=UPI00329A2396